MFSKFADASINTFLLFFGLSRISAVFPVIRVCCKSGYRLPTDLKQSTYNTSIIPLTTHVSLILKSFDLQNSGNL